MFPLFWKAVGICEENCNLKVVGVTSDAASFNLSMYRMHLNMTKAEDVNNDVDVVYRTLNVFADEKRLIYFISDPHLIKTARNCLANSLAGRCTRSMWNDGQYLTWDHISKLFKDDLDCGLYLVPKTANEHIKLSPFSVMNVRLAAQVLSVSAYEALHMYCPPEAEATIYCRMLDQFFDYRNVRNTKEAAIKRKPFLKPYISFNDERLTWLTDTLLRVKYVCSELTLLDSPSPFHCSFFCIYREMPTFFEVFAKQPPPPPPPPSSRAYIWVYEKQ